jgi:hypothetical protein
MNTITSDPGLPRRRSEPRPSYSIHFLLHNILRPLAADDCEIVITAENAGAAVKAARDMLRAFGIEPGHGGAVTLTLPQARPLSGDHRRAVEHARELADAAATVQTLAAYLGVSTQHPSRFFYAAYGAAIDRLRDLLASLDLAGAGQADPGGDPPHAYIPAGLVEVAPYLGYCPPEVRQEAFDAVLEGVEMGAYDRRIITWLAQWDDTTCRTIASLLWRCRLEGRKEGSQ